MGSGEWGVVTEGGGVCFWFIPRDRVYRVYRVYRAAARVDSDKSHMITEVLARVLLLCH